MKVTLKTVTGKVQEVEVESEATVADVKKLLQEEYDLASLRLCYQGEVVADSTVVSTLGLTEKDSFTIAGKKIKVAKAVAVSQAEGSKRSEEQKAQAPPAPAQDGTQPAEVSPPSPAATSVPTQPQVAAGAVSSELVDVLVSMGFEDRAQVALALQAAFMNVDRAVEYLCTGIPPSAQRALQESMAVNQVLNDGTPNEVTTSQLRAALNAIPQYAEIKATYQQNPEVLPVILEQMAQRFPELHAMVMANFEEFQRIIGEVSGEPAFSSPAEAANHLADSMPEEIVITEQDRQALIELVELGGGAWEEQAAMLVYLACRKNQEVAAAVLLEHGGVPPELLAEILHQNNEGADH